MEDKYPILVDSIKNIQDKKTFYNNVMSIKNNINNVIYITDYEVTTKISQHYLNEEIPVTRNSNTVWIRNFYASYIYDLTIYILLGLNKIQCYSPGEFMISSDVIIDLINELNSFVFDIYERNNYEDPINDIKLIVSDLIKNEPVILLEKKVVSEVTPEIIPNEDLEQNLNHEKSDFRNPDCNNSRRNSNNSSGLIEKIDSSYFEKEMFIDDSTSESDTESKNSHDYITDIRDNLVNILANN